MGYKVINKNVIISQEKNIAMDNIFYFFTKESANEYINACNKFDQLGKFKTRNMSIEECTPAEEERYLFDQYHDEYNPRDMKVPNVVIEHPIEVMPGVPYWVTKRELLISY